MTRTELMRRRRLMHRRIRQVVAERRQSVEQASRPAVREVTADTPRASVDCR